MVEGAGSDRLRGLLEFCQWLAETPGSVALHESIYAYPVVESVHVLTLCVFLGLAVMIDLRLMGVMFRGTRLTELSRAFGPWLLGGFVVMVVTGALLFYAIPVKTYLNVFFRIKVVLLVLAGLNALTFHLTIDRRRVEWEMDLVPPRRARMAGALSLVFWAGIVVAGRMIAYNWFDKPI